MTNDELRGLLQDINDRRGRLDPADVVDAARQETSPLHRYFTWDDASAAVAHRLEQARALIRRVKIVYKDEPEQPPRRVRAFINVDPGGESVSRSYLPLDAVAADDVLRERALAEAKRDLDMLAAKYRHLGDAFTELLRGWGQQGTAA